MFEEFMEELERIKNQIVKLYSPSKIILFGSLAKKCIKASSDIDICVIIDTDDKRALARDIYLNVEEKIPVDIVIYTNEEWELYHENTSSFLYNICKRGEIIYGG